MRFYRYICILNDRIMGIYIEGFRTCFKIGLFTLGGGYAMIPIMQREVVDRHKWLSEEDFLDIISLSQALPGVFAVNMSAYIGHRLKGVLGAILFALGTVLPSFIIILLIALCFHNYSQWHWLEAIFKGVRPAVVALIAVPCVRMWKTAGIKLTTVWVPVLTALLIWLVGISPVWIIVAVVVGAYLYGRVLKMEDKEDGL